MIVLNILGYFGRNKQNSSAALKCLCWVHGHYNVLILSVRGYTLDVRIILTQIAPHAERVKHMIFFSIKKLFSKSTLYSKYNLISKPGLLWHIIVQSELILFFAPRITA